MAQVADRVYRNAKVYSVALDGTETHAEALAIRDGKFCYVGDEAGVEAYVGDATEVIDCGGNSVIPGLGDAHMHLAHAGKKFGACGLSHIVPNPAKDTPEGVIEQIQEAIGAYADEHADAAVVRGVGWDRAWFDGGLQGIVRPFTRHDIDAVVPDRPAVILSYCGHRCMFNTAALEAAGVGIDYDDPLDLVVREADGHPSGYVKEPVGYGPIMARVPGYELTPEEHRDCTKRCVDMFNADGYTLLCDCQQGASYPVISKMAIDGELTVRVSGVHNVNDATREADLERAIANRTKFDVGDLFRVDTVKYFADGALSMIEPYLEGAIEKEPGTREELLWDVDHMRESMADAFREGFNIHTHSMGSYSTQKVIDCYENAQRLYPNPDLRNIIAHDTAVAPEDRVRMGASHIIASNQPGWFSSHPASEPVMTGYWGADVVNQFYPCRTLIDNGVVCAFGSDFPVNANYGLAGIQVALTRRCVKKDLAYDLFKDLPAAAPEECITLREAIQAHTIHPAFQAHLEDVTGTIEVGKSAELAILDADIESVPVDEIQDIQVVETVFRGKTVFKRA